tara:strand:- start:295 stop:684 length:390 start_codon:yes stop_codon:yes gene_type:complete
MSHPENVTLLGENVTPSQSQDVTPDVTLYRYVDGEKEILREVPEGYQVLSDGQVWEPLKEARKVKLTGRALQYRLNELGQSVKEIDSETGARLMMVCKSLKNHNQLDSVRYGVQGPTMGTVGESLIPAG